MKIKLIVMFKFIGNLVCLYDFGLFMLPVFSCPHQACASLEEGYLPPVTFVVVQKRHHTRFFPSDHRSRDLTDRSGNILPGSQLCLPT